MFFCVCLKKCISVDVIEKKGLENCRIIIKMFIKCNGDLCYICNCLYRDVLCLWFDIIFIYFFKK